MNNEMTQDPVDALLGQKYESLEIAVIITKDLADPASALEKQNQALQEQKSHLTVKVTRASNKQQTLGT